MHIVKGFVDINKLALVRNIFIYFELAIEII
jgi:hypothetical protein